MAFFFVHAKFDSPSLFYERRWQLPKHTLPRIFVRWIEWCSLFVQQTMGTSILHRFNVGGLWVHWWTRRPEPLGDTKPVLPQMPLKYRWYHFHKVSRSLIVKSSGYKWSSNSNPKKQPAVYLHLPLWNIQSILYLFLIKSWADIWPKRP